MATVESVACVVTCAVSAVENTNAAIEAGQWGDWESAAESSYLAAADAGAVASFFIPGGAFSRVGGLRPRPPTRPLACVNSFVPGRTVVMANGTDAPIEDVEVGDELIATDAETGETRAETVVATIVGEGEKTLVDITLDGGGPGGEANAVTATGNHPIWVTNRDCGAWVEAGRLAAGDLLRSTDGTTTRVVAVAAYQTTATVYNLTVANVHTYYVAAGEDDFLTHNCAASRPNRWRGFRDRYEYAFNNGLRSALERHQSSNSEIARRSAEALPEPYQTYATVALHIWPFAVGFRRGWRDFRPPPSAGQVVGRTHPTRQGRARPARVARQGRAPGPGPVAVAGPVAVVAIASYSAVTVSHNG